MALILRRVLRAQALVTVQPVAAVTAPLMQTVIRTWLAMLLSQGRILETMGLATAPKVMTILTRSFRSSWDIKAMIHHAILVSVAEWQLGEFLNRTSRSGSTISHFFIALPFAGKR